MILSLTETFINLYESDILCLPETFLDLTANLNHENLTLSSYSFLRPNYLSHYKSESISNRLCH